MYFKYILQKKSKYNKNKVQHPKSGAKFQSETKTRHYILPVLMAATKKRQKRKTNLIHINNVCGQNEMIMKCKLVPIMENTRESLKD